MPRISTFVWARIMFLYVSLQVLQKLILLTIDIFKIKIVRYEPRGALPYSKVRYVRLLRPLFLLTPRPTAPKSLHWHPHTIWFFDKKIISLFKKYKTFHNFPSEFVTKHILFGLFGKAPFLCKISLLTCTPFFFVILASPNAPYFGN